MKKKLTCLALSAALVCGTMPGAFAAQAGLANFVRADHYEAGTFADVAEDAWYAESVRTAYELGLVKGSGVNSFDPDGNITIGAALALACRLHSIYHTGAAEFVQGSPWYQVYLDYALAQGILPGAEGLDMAAAASRRQFAAILAGALPAEALEQVNDIADGRIPDVAADAPNSREIYTLYRAGVLTGNDKYGSFTPDAPIGRSAVAAIVSRMADPSLRKTDLKLEPMPTPAVVIPQEYQGSWSVPLVEVNARQEVIVEGDLYRVYEVRDNGYVSYKYGTVTKMTPVGYTGKFDIALLNFHCEDIDIKDGDYRLQEQEESGIRTGTLSERQPLTEFTVKPLVEQKLAESKRLTEESEEKLSRYTCYKFDNKVPDFGALYGVEEIPEKDMSDNPYWNMIDPGLLDFVEQATRNMRTHRYSAKDVARSLGVDYFGFRTEEAALVEKFNQALLDVGYQEAQRKTNGGWVTCYVGYGQMVHASIERYEDSDRSTMLHVPGYDIAKNDTVFITIQPD